MCPAATSGYAPVNGIEVYWESHGDGGTPLIVTHGGYGLASMYADLVDNLAKERQVIAIELQGHGHTADAARSFGWEQFGDDIAGVVSHLGFGQVDLLGHSLGGGASLRCAIQHQALVRRLILLSAPHRRAAWLPEVLAAFDQMSSATLFEQLRQSPLYQGFAEVAPDPASFSTLIDKTGELLRRPYDWSDEIKRLPMPVQLVFGDADSVSPERAAEFFALLGGGTRDAGLDGTLPTESRLAILPGVSHYNMLSSPHLAAVVGEFAR
ncbi:MAG TPA: alpha/beta hydrolase [Streptosporangiaceae bacterium]|nr:alpha/beta hydrolase [Streptosporangiaceae bacterium]